MVKIKCLLVDDEPPALRVLEKYVAEVDQLHHVGSCTNAFKAMEYLHQENIDLMFLDIKMPKLSGLSFLKTLPNPPKVIFTTAFKEYALDAFDLDAIDYLLKPFSFERFIKAVNKLIFLEIPDPENSRNYNHLPFLYFRSERKMVKVFLEEILFIESLKDYVKIHRENSGPLIVKQTISSLENMLPRNIFKRIHRSYIVSLKKVTAYTSKDVEIGKIELPIGRSFGHQFNRFKEDHS
jgi:DNA-binding LytR/AlgR family response regulator